MVSICLIIFGFALGIVVAGIRFNKALDTMGKQWVEAFTEYEESINHILEDYDE